MVLIQEGDPPGRILRALADDSPHVEVDRVVQGGLIDERQEVDEKPLVDARRQLQPQIEEQVDPVRQRMAIPTSRIRNISQIDRGYERIDEKLAQLGAHIQRVD